MGDADLPLPSNESIIEGIGNEVVAAVVSVIASLAALFAIFRPRINFSSLLEIFNTGEEIIMPSIEGENQFVRRRVNNDVDCPICLTRINHAVETNCGHVFCGTCIVTYWDRGGWIGSMQCPCCRQQVTLLLPSFTPEEENAADVEEIERLRGLRRRINSYNRLFSGQPRTWIVYLRDLPTLLRHLWVEFFSLGGLMVMFRVRIGICFIAAILYLFSPLDIIPEAVFGIIGLIDDIFVILLLAIYMTIIYRRLLGDRGDYDG